MNRAPVLSLGLSRWAVSFRSFGIAAISFCALAACSNKMDPKDCAKLRESGFDEINQPHMCSKDADCQVSTWPGCAKPMNVTGNEKLKTLKSNFEKGKCEDKALKCQPAPAVYCQEGLCAFKYAGAQMPAGGGSEMPADKIQINP